MNILKDKVYSIELIAIDLFGSNSTNSIKKAEKWISDQALNFQSLNTKNIYDEHKRKPKIQIMNFLKDFHNNNIILFAKIFRKTNNDIFLFTNDVFGVKKWIKLSNKKKLHIAIEFALKTLLKYENKSVVFVPSGQLTLIFRQLVKGWRENKLKIDDKFIHLALEIYSHGLSDIDKNTEINNLNSKSSNLTHLDHLEAESIHILREVVAESENPVMLYSLGKDSSVMLHLAKKAFFPSKPPFPLLHIDTRWKFQAMYDFRDYMARTSGMELIVHTNPDGVERNINPIDHGSALHTDIMKTEGLKQALNKYKFDIAIGGARRDEEKSRAKERVFSFRTNAHRWDPKNQRPELWRLYNLRKKKDESIRAFPLSNWTEMDVWQYIYREKIPIVPLYFAAERPIIERDGTLIMIDDDRLKVHDKEIIKIQKVRFRSLGCYPLTSAIESDADSIELILIELFNSRVSERQGRTIDSDSSSSMEKKKQEGYF